MSNNTTKHKEREFVERLSFYGDTNTEKNKPYCFDINSIFELQARLIYWMKKVYIRAAWYQVIENGTKVKNERIDLVYLLNYNDLIFITNNNRSNEIKKHHPEVIGKLMEIYKNDGCNNEEITERIKKDIGNFKPDDLSKKLELILKLETMKQEIDIETQILNEQMKDNPYSIHYDPNRY